MTTKVRTSPRNNKIVNPTLDWESWTMWWNLWRVNWVMVVLLFLISSSFSLYCFSMDLLVKGIKPIRESKGFHNKTLIPDWPERKRRGREWSKLWKLRLRRSFCCEMKELSWCSDLITDRAEKKLSRITSHYYSLYFTPTDVKWED